MSRHLLPAAAALVAVATFAPLPASAVTSARGSASNAVGMCQGALPNYEGRLRKRPLAIANEGTTTAFISCAFSGQDLAVDGTKLVYLYFRNQGSAAATVSCTLADGYDGAGGAFVTKSVLIPAGTPFSGIVYNTGDNGGSNFNRLVSLSCSLPAGTSILDAYHFYDVNVGA